MRVLIWFARFLIGVVVLIVTLYFVISLGVTYFKLTGRIVEGRRMFFEMHTPTWAGLLISKQSVSNLDRCALLAGQVTEAHKRV